MAPFSTRREGIDDDDYFALFTNNYYYIKVHYKENKNISKINYRTK